MRHPIDNFRISPLGVVPKMTPGEFRTIHHLSYPEGSSVNYFIPKEISAVQYATIHDAIRLIKQLPSSQVFMAKVDIESALGLFQSHQWTDRFWVSSGRVSFSWMLSFRWESPALVRSLSLSVLRWSGSQSPNWERLRSSMLSATFCLLPILVRNADKIYKLLLIFASNSGFP